MTTQPERTLPDPAAGCCCTPYWQDAGGGHTEYVPEYHPACPEHSDHLYDPRTGTWVLRTPAPSSPPADDRAPLDPDVLAEQLARALYLEQARGFAHPEDAETPEQRWESGWEFKHLWQQRARRILASVPAAEDAARARVEVERLTNGAARAVGMKVAADMRAEAAEAEVKRVRALHYSEPYAQGPDYCAECGHRWPCATIDALADPAAGDGGG